MKSYIFDIQITENQSQQDILDIIDTIDKFGKIVNSHIELFDETGSILDPYREKLIPGKYMIALYFE